MKESYYFRNKEKVLARMKLYRQNNSQKIKQRYRAKYLKNKEVFKVYNARRRDKIRNWLIDYKNKPCTDCGIEYPFYVMELDHISDKLYSIHQLVLSGSFSKLKIEVEKCEVVCANCHRKRTHARGYSHKRRAQV